MEEYANKRIEKSIDFINKSTTELKVSNKCLDIISDIVKIRKTYYGEEDIQGLYWNTLKAGILRTIDNLTLAEVIIHENLVQIEKVISYSPKSLNSVELYELYATITEEYTRILSAQEKYSPAEKIVNTTLEEIQNSGFAEKLIPNQLILNRFLTNIYVQQGRMDEANEIIDKYLEDIILFTSDAPANLRFRLLNDFHSNKVEIAQFLLIKAKNSLNASDFVEVFNYMQRVCSLIEKGTPFHIFAVIKILSEFIQHFEENNVDLILKKQLLNQALLLSIRTEETLHSYDKPSALLSVLQFGWSFLPFLSSFSSFLLFLSPFSTSPLPYFPFSFLPFSPFLTSASLCLLFMLSFHISSLCILPLNQCTESNSWSSDYLPFPFFFAQSFPHSLFFHPFLLILLPLPFPFTPLKALYL